MSPLGGPTRTLWCPFVTAPQDSQRLGDDRSTNNHGKVSIFYHEFTLVLDSFFPSAPGRQMMNIITSREYCVSLFANDSIKSRCNKKIIQRASEVPRGARNCRDLSTSWIKAHTRGAFSIFVSDCPLYNVLHSFGLPEYLRPCAPPSALPPVPAALGTWLMTDLRVRVLLLGALQSVTGPVGTWSGVDFDGAGVGILVSLYPVGLFPTYHPLVINYKIFGKWDKCVID